MQKPLVSILINNYNNGPYLDHCIKSALAQDFPNLEIIVFDDGSSDNSLEVLSKYDGIVKLILAQENYGADSINFNQANAIYRSFIASKGDIICFLDGDDAFLPGKVKAVVEVFEKYPKAVLVQNLFKLIDSQGKVISQKYPKSLIIPTEAGYRSYREFIVKNHSILQFLFMQTSALSFRRSFLEKHLPVKEDRFDKLWADFRLTRKAALFGRVKTIRKPLSCYRIHDSNWIHNIEGRFKKDLVKQAYNYVNNILRKEKGPKLNYYVYRLKKITKIKPLMKNLN